MIELHNVIFTYEGQSAKALDRVSLSVRAGECVLLCGKSGCGKTTITRLVNGLIPYFHDGDLQGTVLVSGKSPSGQEMHQISQVVGSVFQNPRTQFYTVNTTSEIAFGCENMGIEPAEILQRVRKAANDLKIEHLLNRNIFNLSGGEKQIIAFAGAYAMDHDIYILDEPSSNLDISAIAQIREILRLLKAQGKTILIAEHRTYYLQEIVDRAVYMENGKIMAEYTMSQLSQLSDKERLSKGIRSVCFPYYRPARKSASSGKQLRLTNFSCGYRRKTVLTIPDFTSPSGRIIAIVGRNGAGKSTFVSSLCGLLKKKKGIISVEGKSLRQKELLLNGYMVLQEVNHQLFTNSVMEELKLGSKKTDAAELKYILSELDLTGLEDRHPMTLSGGQKQRLAIAAAMFCGKSLLIFDEPTSGLDYTHMVQTGKLLGTLRDKGFFVFVITHDREFVIECCDSVIQIENGGISRSYPLNSEGYVLVQQFFNDDLPSTMQGDIPKQLEGDFASTV